MFDFLVPNMTNDDASEGGGVHRFVKSFHKIPDFFKGMLP